MQIRSFNNPELEIFFKALDRVRTPKSKMLITRAVRMHKVIANAMQGNFFRYNGSLTTPGCQQAVTWTLFETPIGISMQQVRFHKLMIVNELSTNFEPDIHSS
jgi:carbonic anhydrase